MDTASAELRSAQETADTIETNRDAMIAEALKLMHDKKITNLFVLDNKKPIGVIHIHDLLNNGVA